MLLTKPMPTPMTSSALISLNEGNSLSNEGLHIRFDT